ncbi:hypothetical protein NDU88_000550 [Pleurodeles waltl]|uniref:Uncharacterized protein n=1 Tax=Pleurodeles waltl TaxID=8319 RepID=A0AAV7LV16_PLEWA|nr:hypothetical protein NDU88_000550 [Pleurodeles waltl]
MEQECADALNQVFSDDGVLWTQAHQDIEAYRAQHFGSGMDSAHLIDDGEESPLTGVSLRQGPGVLFQKPSLEAESADRINNNQEPFQEDILQSSGTCVLKSDMEVEQLTDFRESNISGNEGEDELATAQHDQSSDLKSVSDAEDDWGGSLDENQDSLSDRSDLLEELEDLEAQNLLEEEGLEADDQGICVDDQDIADGSDEDAGEAETMPIGSALCTHQENCQNKISFVGGTSNEYPQLVVEEYGSTYKKLSPITNVEEHTGCSLSTHNDSQSKVPSFVTREQEIKLTSICDSGECFSSAKNYKRNGYEEVSLMARKSQLFSFLDEEDTIMSVKRDDDKTGTDGMILIHENAGTIVSLHQQPQKQNPGNPTNGSSALAGAEAPCDVLGSAVTPSNGHLVHQQESSEDVLLNQLPFPGCSEKIEDKYEVMQQDDFMTLDIPVSSEITVHEERFDFDAEQIDVKVSDQSEVQSLSSQDEVYQANSETDEDLDIEDNQGHQHGGRLFHAESIYCPPGARNYEYRLDDSYDSSEDKVEAREFMVDRGRDISDKLDPEILHLLELHLLKQQLVVIEEEEEEEEENDFDGFHVNAHKLHFENVGPSKKMGHLLDMVLEEPELLEEKEEEEDELKEVHLECKTLSNDDLDEETHSCEESVQEINNRDFAEAHCEDVDITATFADLGREESDRILQITLQPVVGTEISFVEELGFCKEEDGHRQQDLDNYYHSDCDVGHKEVHIASRKTNIALKNGLDEHESLKTPMNGDQLSKKDVLLSQALELDNRLQRKNEDTFNFHQPTTDIVTEIDSHLCSAFYHELDISNTKSSVKKQLLDRSQTTDTNNINCFENVPKSCSLRQLGLTAECTELASEHVGWPLEMSGEKALVVPGTFTQNNVTDVRYPKPTTLKHLTKEPPSYCDMKTHLSQQNPTNPLPRAEVPEVLEAEVEHANAENATEAARHEDTKLQKDHLKRKEVRAQSSTARGKCSREKIKTPLVAVDTYNEKGPDVYTQLEEALEWAQASEQRNSELQGELEVLRLRCDALCQEKAELVTLLKKREAELNSLLIQREGWMPCGDQEDIAGEATKIHSAAQIETLETTQEASPHDTAECYTGSKQTYRQTIMQKEFDLLRQESRAMVEQLNSLQEELRAQNHSRKQIVLY